MINKTFFHQIITSNVYQILILFDEIWNIISFGLSFSVKIKYKRIIYIDFNIRCLNLKLELFIHSQNGCVLLPFLNKTNRNSVSKMTHFFQEILIFSLIFLLKKIEDFSKNEFLFFLFFSLMIF